MSGIAGKKHAYLIMAHNNFSQLQTLIDLLDDPQNDIYLHVDKRAETFQPNSIRARNSNVVIVNRIRVNWGGHSQIECELNLLKASVRNHYGYYHLLSGADLPLKTQKEIHSFFDNAFPNNFIQFDPNTNKTGSFISRINTFHFLQDYIGRNPGLWIAVLERIEYCSLQLQKRIGIHRKQYIPAYKGTNWFSITHELAEHILSKEALIKKQFYHSICADEIFLHSIVMDSPYRNTVVNNSLREIDWTRGSPYVYRKEDVDVLLSSKNLFARKFDECIDCDAIKKIVEHLT
jgi:hypothetical protein